MVRRKQPIYSVADPLPPAARWADVPPRPVSARPKLTAWGLLAGLLLVCVRPWVGIAVLAVSIGLSALFHHRIARIEADERVIRRARDAMLARLARPDAHEQLLDRLVASDGRADLAWLARSPESIITIETRARLRHHRPVTAFATLAARLGDGTAGPASVALAGLHPDGRVREAA